MLYLDQPTQVGMSYDVLANITANLLTGEVTLLNATDDIPEQNNTLLVGTYPSQKVNSTAQGSENGARALWHFAQVWFQEFPAYHPNDSRISIATESYGGRYGPSYTAFFEEQNMKIENGTWTEMGEMYIIHLDTLMIINGCIDRQVQWPSYPHIAYNNTYGIQAVNQTIYESMMDAYTRPNGCRDQISTCRTLSLASDPQNLGHNTTVNKVCQAAESFCTAHVRDPYTDLSGRNYYDFATLDPDPNPPPVYEGVHTPPHVQNTHGVPRPRPPDSGRNYYDFATLDPDPNPPPFYEGFLNQPHVQSALGVPLNWTQSSGPVSTAFRSIGDYPRPGWLEDLTHLLENNIKVALVYGDRDFACNWIGGEAVSLALNYSSSDAFKAAGYQPIHTNASYVGGQVRQHGNLSFSRVYESGHEVPFYQPETAYRIFMRALFNRDVSTGELDTVGNGSYGTVGPSSSWGFKNEGPEQPVPLCYVLDPESTCSEEQIAGIANGSVAVRDWIVVDGGNNATGTGTSSGMGGSSGTASVATGGAAAVDRVLDGARLMGVALLVGALSVVL